MLKFSRQAASLRRQCMSATARHGKLLLARPSSGFACPSEQFSDQGSRFRNQFGAGAGGSRDYFERERRSPRQLHPISNDRVSKLENLICNYRHADWTTQAPRHPAVEEELFRASHATGGNFDSYANVDVQVLGKNLPAVVEQFSDLCLHPFLAENVSQSHYSSLTPVQKYAISIQLAMRDMIACAQTGSGKTAAFLIPIMHRMLVEGGQGAPDPDGGDAYSARYPLALILAPTRELGRQIFAEAVKLAYRTAIKPALLHGGAENKRKQIDLLKCGSHLLIGTPGRVVDMIEQSYISLKYCRQLVLDEADRMLDMGFLPQLDRIIRAEMPDKWARQTAMFSATFPREIRNMSRNYLKDDHLYVEVGKTGTACDTIDQRIFSIQNSRSDRSRKLLELLSSNRPFAEYRVLIFVNRKDDVDELSQFLRSHGFASTEMHGDISQFRREQNLDSFRSGRSHILIATDVAARGLDISNVSHVVNFHLPNNIDDYVHRIGRTGRLGQTGLASSFFTDADAGLARELVAVLEAAKQEVPSFLRQYTMLQAQLRGPGNQRKGVGASFKQRFDRKFGSSSQFNYNNR